MATRDFNDRWNVFPGIHHENGIQMTYLLPVYICRAANLDKLRNCKLGRFNAFMAPWQLWVPWLFQSPMENQKNLVRVLELDLNFPPSGPERLALISWAISRRCLGFLHFPCSIFHVSVCVCLHLHHAWAAVAEEEHITRTWNKYWPPLINRRAPGFC